MITMEFDEMKKIWDTQNNQPLYVLDEKGLHNRIQSKMNTLHHLTGISEWMLILIYFSAGCILLARNPWQPGVNVFIYLGAIWLFGIVAWLIVSRIRRINASRQFDRSIAGDINHTISLASYQMNISRIIRWTSIPMGAMMMLSGWESGKFIQVSAVILLSYTLAFFITKKDYQINKRRKQELQVLKEKLETGI